MRAAKNIEAARTSPSSFFQSYGGSAPDNYERYFVPAVGAPLATDLIEAAAVGPGERVLDVACGTGVVARLAAARAGKTGTVAGLDLNPGMLAVARSVTPADAAITWHEANAQSMPLPDGAFDVVLCQLGLQFMPDKTAALREMRRVLTRGGRLALNVPGPTPRPFAIMDEALARHIGPDAAGFVQAVFALHDPGEIRSLIGGAGFHDIHIEPGTKTLRFPSPAAFLWQYVHSTPLISMVTRVDDDRRAALEHDVVARLQDFVESGALIVRQGIVVATARK